MASTLGCAGNMQVVVLPDVAYVPGRTPRPAEGSFDLLRETVQPEMGVAELGQTMAFQAGLKFLDHGYFWEAHEVLEPVWMALPADTAPRLFVQGVIQLANGFLKLEMARPAAALRLAGIARPLLRHDAGALLAWAEQMRLRRLVDSLEAVAKNAL